MQQRVRKENLTNHTCFRLRSPQTVSHCQDCVYLSKDKAPAMSCSAALARTCFTQGLDAGRHDTEGTDLGEHKGES